MLAHRASGDRVAEQIAGRNRRFGAHGHPSPCFTDPEVVVVGRTPGEAYARADRIDAASPMAAP